MCKLDIHKGPAGSRPRFRNNFPVALSSHAGREQKHLQKNVSSSSEDIFEPLCIQEFLVDVQH